ncbi:regulatory protein TetR [Paracidovorax avenae ATCC 19860]|uniref:Regulatory protein TetR n=1 Tax=Paracidovorax avenae (strain ATCC 19860 / DSM 7227 / CCUG 15838 / JCM 20985 / LMG 2117 / NCPPB 1011) TaxID=643561 RepID=F0Q821_PARA1|nr:regulatory protein TetR [Paracidovorax avenae ATCC 19860]
MFPEGTPLTRSQATKDRILDAARTLFASQGYDGTTVREVAALAQTNPALVIRYYGSKEALFLAAAEFDLQLPDLAGVSRDSLGERLAAHFFTIWEDSPSGRQLVALLRAAATHADARARMQDIFERQLRAAVRKLAAPAADADVRAALIASQMLGFALVRYVLEFSARGMSRQMAVRALGATLQRYLVEPI